MYAWNEKKALLSIITTAKAKILDLAIRGQLVSQDPNDEPVSALDVSVQARVLNLLRDLRRELGLAIVLIAHDLAVVKNVCDNVCVMEKGLFVDVGKTEDVFEKPKSEYTKHLLSVIPKIPTF